MRDVFREFSFLTLDGTEHLLLECKVACGLCFRTNARAGIFDINKTTLKGHQTLHGSRSEAGVPAMKQLTLADVGIAIPSPTEELADALVVGHLLRKGVAYSSIPDLLSQDFLTLVHSMRAGSPSTYTLRESTIPSLCAYVTGIFKEALKGVPIALAIDGGSSRLGDGAKVVCVIAVSPALPYDLLLAAAPLATHENAESQAALIVEVGETYDLKKDQIRYIVGDNASVNAATVRVLNEGHAARLGVIIYSRCLPHTLALSMKAFTTPFDDAFSMSGFLHRVRKFIKAGGGMSRRRTLGEYGVALSCFDYAETRWDGFFVAIQYVASVQTERALKLAEKRLKRAAAAGDASAKAALEEPGKPELIFNALYECVECIAEELEADDVEKTDAGFILRYLSDIKNFAAFTFLAEVLKTVPDVFGSLQGGGQYVLPLNDDGERRSPSMILDELWEIIEGLRDPETRENYLATTRSKCEAQQELILKRAKEYGEAIVKGKPGYDDADLPTARANYKVLLNAAMKMVEKTLLKSLKVIVNAACSEKLKEARAGLRFRDRFDCSAASVDEDWRDDAVIAGLLGFPKPPATEASTFTRLVKQWRGHVAAVRAQPAGQMRPVDVYRYWKNLAAVSPDLSTVALKHWLRPVSSAAAERVFSVLSLMDEDTRQSMGEDVVKQVLFVTANSRILSEMATTLASSIRKSMMESVKIGPKRPREEDPKYAFQLAALADARAASTKACLDAREAGERAGQAGRVGGGGQGVEGPVDAPGYGRVPGAAAGGGAGGGGGPLPEQQRGTDDDPIMLDDDDY
jgi:hypothetical protein